MLLLAAAAKILPADDTAALRCQRLLSAARAAEHYLRCHAALRCCCAVSCHVLCLRPPLPLPPCRRQRCRRRRYAMPRHAIRVRCHDAIAISSRHAVAMPAHADARQSCWRYIILPLLTLLSPACLPRMPAAALPAAMPAVAAFAYA